MDSIPSSPSPSRRTLLTAGAAAAGLFAAGCAAGRAKSKPLPVAPRRPNVRPDEPVRLGVIGVGGMGGAHMNSLLGFKESGKANIEVVALSDVCSVRLERRLAQAQERDPDTEIRAYADYTELLKRGDIHGVVVASPEHWHAQMTIDAMAAGKDVYVEKPMTLRLDDVLSLYRATEANPHVIVQVGTQYMMGQKYAHAKKLIADGTIGHPTFSQTSYCRNSVDGEWLYGIDQGVSPEQGTIDWDAWLGDLGPREWDTEIYHRWRRYRDFSTGIIGDLLVHQMTPMAWALDAGWPTRVTASGGHYVDKAMENHDQVNLTVEWESEHTMVVAGSTCNATGISDVIRGHKANMFLGGNRIEIRPEQIYADDVDPETVNCETVGNDQDQHRVNWLNAIRTREKPLSDIDLGSKIMVVVDLAARSMWEGKAFHFDPEEQVIRGA